MRSARLPAALLAAALAAGCGSTVQVASQRSSGGASADGVATDPGAVDGTGGGSSSGTTGGPAGADSPTAVVAGPRPSASEAGGGTDGSGALQLPGSTGPESGRGFTRTTIDIGFPETDDPGPALAALGFTDVATGDPKKQMLTVVADINRRGGLAGRKINPVFHMFSTAQQLSDPATANEAACVDWTQDHKVFAVIYPGALISDEGLFACMAKSRTPLILGGGQDASHFYGTTYAKYPLVFNLGGMLREHYLDIAIRRYVERGFFTPWDNLNGRPGTAPVKIGYLWTDSAFGRVDHDYLKRQLAKHGLKPGTEIGCAASLQEKIQCQQSAVLRMQTDGVTHILGAGLTFMSQADSQGYRPRYVIPIQPKTLEDNAPKTQLAGSMYESWIPAMDTSQAYSPGDPSPATGRCKKLMRAAGEDVTGYGLALWQMETICDMGFFLEAAVRANPLLGPDGLRAGFELLGAGVPSALTFATLLSPSRHASANAVRDVAFVCTTANCSDGHFAYTSKTSYER